MNNLKPPFRGWGYKKLQAGKPDSVVGYHLSAPIITYRDQSAYPVSCPDKSGLGRAALKRYYTWHFSMQGLPACMITHTSCELLPHIFTLPSSPSPLVEKGKG